VDLESFLRVFLPFLLGGAALTIVISAAASVIGIGLGLLVAAGRLSGRALISAPSALFVDFFRSTPLFVHLVWFFFALPILTGLSLDAITTGIAALGVYSAAYFAEVFRTGILAIPVGQRDAALAAGMTDRQAVRRIVLPQAVRMVLPPMVNTLVVLVKDSSLFSVLGVAELMYRAGAASQFSSRPLVIMTVTGLIYIALTYPTTVLGSVLQRQVAKAT